MAPTVDPHVSIEEEYEGYVRYRRDDGRRWSVTGTCDYRGDCMVGAAEPWPPMRREDRLDVPVTPEFSGCCSFRFRELDPA